MKGRNKRDNKTKYLLILLLLIAVGYAAIATTLKINGTSTIKSAKWDVYWENPQVLSGSVTNTAPTLSESDTKATFDVTLNEPGDYYEFTIDAVNNGSLDAKIDTNGIVKQVKNSSGEVVTPTILKYEVTNNDAGHTAIQEGHILAKKSGNTPTRETYRVRVEYRNDEEINPSDLDDNDLVFTIEFSIKYVQGPKASQQSSAINYITRQNEGQITPGYVIGIGETEDFYVISSNSEKTVLLAKYNLLVGYNPQLDAEMTSQNTQGYGLQSIDVVGGYDLEPQYGEIAFSSTQYWMNGNNLISQYNKNDTIYYDSEQRNFKYRLNDETVYPYVYDENSNVYQYISGENGYINRLKEMGAPSTITGRLLTYEEADAAQSIEDNGTSIIFNNQSYWTGSALGSHFTTEHHVLSIMDNYFYDASFENDPYCGVRPVIEIPTSELQ